MMENDGIFLTEPQVSFETAKLAHDKGFTLEAFHDEAWEELGEIDEYLVHPTEHRHLNQEGDLNLPTDIITNAYRILAPTQALLQKWLRESHNIHAYAICNFYNKSKIMGYLYQLDCFDENDIHDGEDHDMDQMKSLGEKLEYETYEEALEVGLQQALKLIK